MNQNYIRNTTSHKATDNTTIHYRYDASGNRVEKRVEKDGETSLTRYVRDAAGNVMAVYRGEEQAEWHLYGSSRLGMGRGKSQSGQLKLGLRSYELSNHLGNVLAVITDNACLPKLFQRHSTMEVYSLGR